MCACQRGKWRLPRGGFPVSCSCLEEQAELTAGFDRCNSVALEAESDNAGFDFIGSTDIANIVAIVEIAVVAVALHKPALAGMRLHRTRVARELDAGVIDEFPDCHFRGSLFGFVRLG